MRVADTEDVCRYSDFIDTTCHFSNSIGQETSTVRMIQYYKLERLCIETVVTYFNTLSPNFPGWKKKNLSQYSRYAARESNPEPPEYEGLHHVSRRVAISPQVLVTA
jgi:hypothetical protein